MAKSNTDFDFVAVTPWWPAALINTARVLYGNEISSPSGQVYQKVGLQLAGARVDEPDAWAVYGAQIPEDTYDRVDINIATAAAGKFWARFGYGIRCRYTDNVVTGQYYTQIDTDTCGRLVPAKTLTLRSISGSRFAPVTGWVPALGMTGIRAAVVVTSWLTNLQYRICYRTRNDSFDTGASGVGVGPTSDWLPLGSLNTPTANSDLVLSHALTSGDQEIQFGIEWSGTAGQADVTVAIAIQH